jgi:hypothetical protein
MNCLQIEIPRVKENLNNLAKIFNSENIAYSLLAKNNGNNLDLTPNGKESTLFQYFNEKYGGNLAYRHKAMIYTQDFLKDNNWLKNGIEPSVDIVESYIQTQKAKSKTKGTPKIDSIQDKAKQFAKNHGKKLSNNNLITSDSKIVKSKLNDLLSEASVLFNKHGIFLDKGDVGIVRRNALLFENLLDRNRLLDRIKENKNNPDYIKTMNSHFVNVTGKKAILKTKEGLTIKEDVLKEYNAASYANYVNSMYRYLNDKREVTEDFISSPIVYKLKQERTDLIKTKQKLEATGGKKATINELDSKINKLAEKIDTIQNSSALEDVWADAYDDFDSIDNLLQMNSMSRSEFNDAKRKLDMWMRAGDFTRNFEREPHLFLDEEELENQAYRDKFLELRQEAESRVLKLMDRGEKLLENVVNQELRPKNRISINEILKLPHKVTSISKQVLSLNRVGQALAQFIHKIVNDANAKAFTDAKTKSRVLADLYKTVKDSGFDLDLFYQRDKDGTRTGRLAHKFSNMFFRNIAKIKQSTAAYKKEMLFLDPVLLTEGEESAKAPFLQELENHLGKRATEKYVKKAIDKYTEYKSVRQEYIKEEFGIEEISLNEEQQRVLKDWEIENSPVNYMNTIKTTKEKSTKNLRGKDFFLVTVPKKFYKDGKKTNWYDNNFTAIESNDAAYKFYNLAEEITNNTQDIQGNAAFTSTSIAFIKRDLLSKFSEVGIAEFLTKDVYNSMIKSVTTTDATAFATNPLTGEKEKAIKSNLTGMDKLIKKRYEELLEEAGGKTKTSDEERMNLMNKASDEIFLANKDNLFMALNLMNLSSLSMQHKHNIEDAVNLAMTYLPNSTVEIGNDYMDAAGNPVAKKYIDNMQEMVQHFLDMTYYEEGKVDTSKVLGKLRTKEERQRAKEIKAKLTDPKTLPKDIPGLEQELKKLGANVTLNTLAKNVMGFVRIKALGWNVPAALANLVYGKITNFYKAVDGRLFTMKQLGQAEGLILREGKKFNHILENYNILGDIMYEFEETNKFVEKKNWFFKAIQATKPYQLQTWTEKQNQGTIMIAMMLNQKVTNDQGEIKSLWEAINDEGVLPTEWSMDGLSEENAIIDMIGRIKSQIEEIHGDYSNPLLIKKSTAGQAISMFRLWFFEAFHSRFGAEKKDYIRGITTKGRYLSLSLLKDYRFNLRKLYKAYKNNQLSEVDAANLRTNLAELGIISMSAVIGYMLKNGICGDDESCKKANAKLMFLLNMQRRIDNDLTFYMSPSQIKSFINNPTAAANLLGDVSQVIDIVGTSLFGEDEDMYYQRGFYEGRNKFWVWAEKQVVLPIPLGQIRRLEKYSSELLNL